MLTLTWPLMLLALPLPLLVYFFAPRRKQEQGEVFAPSLMIMAEQKAQSHEKPHLIFYVLAALIWVSLVLASTRPTYVGEPQAINDNDRNMMLAVDISQSMLEEDMAFRGRLINRLQAVKAVMSDFIIKRQGDRLGLILFGARAYIQTPLTFDLDTLKTLLDEAVVGLAGGKTAIGDAIGLAVKRLQNLPESHRVLILLTDGQNTAGEIEPLQAAKLAAQAGVKIHTIGIGADELIKQGFFGPRRVNPSRDLDEVTLTSISQQTGGNYYRARNLEELDEIYAELDAIEAIKVEEQMIRPEKSLFHYPLISSFIFAFLFILFKQSFMDTLLKRTLEQLNKINKKGAKA